MKVLLTGATGWIGSAVLRDLLQAGHEVLAAVRSEGDARAVRADGVDTITGEIADANLLATAAETADGVVHTAMGSGLGGSNAIADDISAIETFGRVYRGSRRPIVVTHGLGPLTSGRTFTEQDRPGIVEAYPRASEQTAFRLAEQGVATSVVRPARSVHGLGERHGFVPMLAALARKTGVSAFVGYGEALWPACHRLDVARTYRLALERAAIGEAYHAVAEGVPFREVAGVIGRQLDVPAVSIAPDQAAGHFGDMAMWVVGRDKVSTDMTRARLGWEPKELRLLEDIDRPAYFEKNLLHAN